MLDLGYLLDIPQNILQKNAGEIMDVTQVLLVAVVTVLTILLAIIGIQVVFILSEIRKSLIKVNRMLEDTASISHNISKSVNNVGGLVDGLKAGLHVVNFFGKKKEKEHHA